MYHTVVPLKTTLSRDVPLNTTALGFEPPGYFHAPLVVSSDGFRLAKRHGDTRISSMREAGISPERVIGVIAWWCGWAEFGEELSLASLLGRFDPRTIPSTPVVLDDRVKRHLSIA